MTGDPTIDYEALAQEAMRGLVRTVLQRIAKSGLPGDHHFYISFDTSAPGVSLSKRLREKYPNEMTIVLQHRFWDLAVTDDRFEVKLSFDGIPERLVVPFSALKVFFDPSVRYGLQFEDADMGQESSQLSNGYEPEQRSTRQAAPRKPRQSKKSRTEREPTEAPTPVAAGSSPPRNGNGPQPVATGASKPPSPAPQPAAATIEAHPAGPITAPGGAQIVSLSDFRKK